MAGEPSSDVLAKKVFYIVIAACIAYAVAASVLVH